MTCEYCKGIGWLSTSGKPWDDSAKRRGEFARPCQCNPLGCEPVTSRLVYERVPA